MKLVLNLRDSVAPLALEIDGDEEAILSQVRKAIETQEILDLTDSKGERVLIPSSSIGYALVPSKQHAPVGFGRL